MRATFCGLIACFLSIVSVLSGAEPDLTPGQASKVDFLRDVAPILQQQCIACHGPTMQIAELRLDQRRFVLGNDADPDLIKAGQSAESLLIKRLIDRKLGILMPPTFPFPPGEKVGLSETAIQTLKNWIDQGATWPAEVSLATESSATSNPHTNALFGAIRDGNHRVVAEFLGRDKSLVNSRNRYDETPLMQAAIYSDVAMVNLLLEQGADVNLASRDGATALMRAAGNYEKVERLLARGATIDAKSNYGRTPLLIATSFPGNVKTVQLLLERGAKIDVQDQFGDTCLVSACKRGDAGLAKVLLQAGANVAAGSSWPGQAPLIWAAEEGNLATIACLLEHGAGKIQPHLDIALSSAAARQSPAAVRLLLEQGANPNAPSPVAGYTPLMWAAYSENVDEATVRLLLDKGANPKAKGANGETPLSLAKKHGRTAIVEQLERAGAE